MDQTQPTGLPEQPEAPSTAPSLSKEPPAQPPAARRRAGSMVAGGILVAIGFVLLIGEFFSFGGGVFFLSLGLAFLIARLLTHAYGFAVPSGILLGFGLFVAFDELGWLGTGDGGWFFVFLGLGFVLVYLIGFRPSLIWPFFPAAPLLLFGLALLGASNFAALAFLAPLANLWPLVLVSLGIWLIFRDRLPEPIRRFVGIVGGLLLLLFGGLVFAASLASASGSFAFGGPGVRLGPMMSETMSLREAIERSDSLRITNPNGRIDVRPTEGNEVRVTATKRFWNRSAIPDVRIGREGDGVRIEALVPNRGLFTLGGQVDLVVEAPQHARTLVEGGSGDTRVQGLRSDVDVRLGSGDLVAENLAAGLNVRIGSGDIRLTNIAGQVRGTTGSGSVRGIGLSQVVEMTTASGDLDLSGVFARDARLTTSSGEIDIRFETGSAVRLDVGTSSGDITVRNLTIEEQQRDRRTLRANFGASPSGTLTIRTASGDISLQPAR